MLQSERGGVEEEWIALDGLVLRSRDTRLGSGWR